MWFMQPTFIASSSTKPSGAACLLRELNLSRSRARVATLEESYQSSLKLCCRVGNWCMPKNSLHKHCNLLVRAQKEKASTSWLFSLKILFITLTNKKLCYKVFVFVFVFVFVMAGPESNRHALRRRIFESAASTNSTTRA
jgi:hypothetical protein